MCKNKNILPIVPKNQDDGWSSKINEAKTFYPDQQGKNW